MCNQQHCDLLPESQTAFDKAAKGTYRAPLFLVCLTYFFPNQERPRRHDTTSTHTSGLSHGLHGLKLIESIATFIITNRWPKYRCAGDEASIGGLPIKMLHAAIKQNRESRVPLRRPHGWEPSSGAPLSRHLPSMWSNIDTRSGARNPDLWFVWQR